MYDRLSWRRFFNLTHPFTCLRYIKSRIVSWKSIGRRIDNAKKFICKYIEPYCSSITDNYDVIICGSDQIWRKQPEKFGYNPVYFGAYKIHASKQISYAASMGVLPETQSDIATIKKLVHNLDNISVRENDLCVFLRRNGFDNVSVGIDPTLFHSAEQWDTIIPPERLISEKYALFYEVAGMSFDERQMREFCDNMGLKLVILRTHPIRKETDREIYSASPDKFVNLVRYADFVFSSSFHGLAFSIIFHKNFLCSVSKRSSRLLSLLDTLGITGHYVEPMSKIPVKIEDVDYDLVNIQLEKIKHKSINYVSNNLCLDTL